MGGGTHRLEVQAGLASWRPISSVGIIEAMDGNYFSQTSRARVCAHHRRIVFFRLIFCHLHLPAT